MTSGGDLLFEEKLSVNIKGLMLQTASKEGPTGFVNSKDGYVCF